MKCDKCGFEHNSRSECPKCGQRVVYVNEEYQKRREEWERTHKDNMEQNASELPFIMHSTREDYDRRHGKDRATNLDDDYAVKDKKDMSFSLIFQRFISAILSFFSNINKKRKKKTSEKIDESGNKNTVFKKRYTGKKKIISVIAACAVLLVMAIVAVLIVNSNKDRSHVAYFDGNIMHFSDGSHIDNLGNSVVTRAANDAYLFTGDSSIIRCVSNKVETIPVENASLMAFSMDLSRVMYQTDEGVFITDFESTKKLIEFDKSGADTSCILSDNGNYGAFTICMDSDDFSMGEYITYYVDRDMNAIEIMRDFNSKELIKIDDDGRLIYTDMTTAAYGIVNARQLKSYKDGTTAVLVENFENYHIYGDKFCYIDKAENLYCFDIVSGTGRQLDMDVTAFLDNELDSEMIVYVKTKGIYAYLEDKTRFLSSCQGDFKVFYSSSKDIFACLKNGKLYNKKGELICAVNSEKDVLDMTDAFVILDKEGNLFKYDMIRADIEKNVSFVTAIENSNAIAYGIGDKIYIFRADKENSEVLVNMNEGCKKLIYSGKKYYYLTGDDTLYKISKKNKYEKLSVVKDVFLEN